MVAGRRRHRPATWPVTRAVGHPRTADSRMPCRPARDDLNSNCSFARELTRVEVTMPCRLTGIRTAAGEPRDRNGSAAAPFGEAGVLAVRSLRAWARQPGPGSSRAGPLRRATGPASPARAGAALPARRTVSLQTPPLTGRFSVGTMSLCLTDRSRRDPSSPSRVGPGGALPPFTVGSRWCQRPGGAGPRPSPGDLPAV